MARKKPSPAITYTAILNYAINYLTMDIRNWENALAELPDCDERLAEICARQIAEIEALKQMYKFETGEEFY